MGSGNLGTRLITIRKRWLCLRWNQVFPYMARGYPRRDQERIIKGSTLEAEADRITHRGRHIESHGGMAWRWLRKVISRSHHEENTLEAHRGIIRPQVKPQTQESGHVRNGATMRNKELTSWGNTMPSDQQTFRHKSVPQKNTDHHSTSSTWMQSQRRRKNQTELN